MKRTQRMLAFGFVAAATVTPAQVRTVEAQQLQPSQLQPSRYPVRPIRIVASEAGGGTDFAARMIAQGLSAALGQQVIVENRSGEVVPADTVARATPDGYTLLLNGSSMLFLPFLRDRVPYDPQKSFAPVTLAHKSPNVLVVNPASGVKSAEELLALARAKPGELNYGSAGSGSSTHLAAELFKSTAAVNVMHIPYKGSGSALNALMGAHVQMLFATPSSAAPHLKSGRLRALGVTIAEPSPVFPGVPTIASAGLPGYECASTNGILAPAGTPPAIIRRLNEEIVKFLQRPDIRERFLAAGSEVIASPPEVFGATIRSEMAKWGKLIRAAGIRAD